MHSPALPLRPSSKMPFCRRPRRLASAIDCCLPATARNLPATGHALLSSSVALGLACSLLHTAMAATYVVDTPFDPGPFSTTSLRQAVFQANGAPNNIVEFGPGLNGSTVTLQGGEIPITASMYIAGPGADKVTISGNHLSRIFDIGPPSGTINVTISGVTLSGGYSTEEFFGGGAILTAHTQLTLQHSRLSGNQGNGGGGLQCAASTCVLNDVTMDSNLAPIGGGGGLLVTDGTATVVGSVISGNSGRNGGGIKVLDGGLTVTDTRIRGNMASYSGGGLYLFTFTGDNFSLNQVSITDNQSGSTPGSGGGGIFFVGNHLSVIRSLISGNSSNSIYNDAGGAIATNGQNSALYVYYSTIYGNYAVNDAGGILSNGKKLLVLGSTIAGNNTGGYGPGNAIEAAGNDNSLIGTIVANNFNRGGTSDLEGNFNVDYSLVKSAGAGVLTLQGLGNIVNGTDPQLGPLAVNGGPTLTMMPAAGSVVIDHGDPSTPNGKDQRNLPRVADGRADIGAVERQYPEDMIFRYGFDSS